MILQRRAIALVVIFAITYTLSPEAIAAGRTASSAANTILNGKGAPKSSLGIDGDFYIDTRSLLLYGPKRSGKWPAPQSLQGPTGPSGSAGKNGSDGKTVASNVSSSNGALGPVGPQGEKGEKGEKGETGLPGAIGVAGPAGAMGLPGPVGATGATGAAGVNGSNGSAGAQGPAGAPGITLVVFGQLTFSDLSGGVGSGQYLQLNDFQANKSYLLRVRIYSFQPNDLTEYFLPLSLSVTSTSTEVVPLVSYVLAHGYSYRTGVSRYENSIDAEIVLDGRWVDVNYGITLLVTSGRTTAGSELVKISGSYVYEEVQNAQNHA